MKKGNILLLALGIVIFILVGSTLTTYNSLVARNESVATRWNSLQQQYQRRAKLVPNLLNSVKRYAQSGCCTFQEVETAQAKATQCSLSADKLTPESLKQFREAQENLSLALNNLRSALKEKCPELDGDEIFSDFQAQLEEVGNEISQCEQRYNQGVDNYNTKVRHFPANIVAPLFGFHKKTALNE